jgi:hypothetical protein
MEAALKRPRPGYIAGMALVSLAGALLNVLVFQVLRGRMGIPLHLDTVLTMTVTFFGGAFWGALTGALTNPIVNTMLSNPLIYNLYGICNVAVALVTAVFIRWFPRELGVSAPARDVPQSRRFQDLLERAIILALLAFALCIVISVLGGICSTVINVMIPVTSSLDPNTNFSLALARRNLPPVIVEILSRIPVNIPDRLISSFAGYGVALIPGRLKNLRIN